MISDARVRINEHRLVKESVGVLADHQNVNQQAEMSDLKILARKNFRRISMLHFVVFFLSFVFTTGAAVLGVFLWVRPGSLTALVFVGLLAGFVFVASFASLRTVALKHLVVLHKVEETDEKENHLVKGIVYGLLAFVVALLIAGFLIKVASATTY